MESYIPLAAGGVIIIFLLLQWFMSVRPWLIWGLVLPVLFAGAWYCVAAQPLFFSELGFTPEAVRVLSFYCKLGAGISLAEFALCRGIRYLRRRQKDKQRQQRLEEKRRRREQEAG